MSKRIQNYEIGRVLGKGEMAVTSQAQYVRINRSGEETIDPELLAFKELNKEYALNASYRNKFIEEVNHFQTLALPNSVEILDVVIEQTLLAVIMPLYEGTLLHNYLPKTGLPLVEVLDILEPIADAVDSLHFNGLVHGNLQPRKILLAKKGLVPLLLDVGIFKDAFWMGCIQMSPYRAPEDITTKRLSPMSDIYSFALIAYELLSGKLPWSRKLKDEEVQRVKEGEHIDPLSIHCPDIAVNLLGAIMDCLVPDPTQRRPRCMDIINYMRLALDDDEQTGEFANIDPVVLLKAQKAVSELDKRLVKLEDKIRTKQVKLQAEYEKLGNAINTEKEKVAALTKSVPKKSKVVKKKKGFWSNLFSFGTEVTKETTQSKRMLSPEELMKARERMKSSIDDMKAKYLSAETKIRNELDTLQQEEKEIKSELRTYGEIHPSLLGFRAVKPFSTAWLRVGRLKQQMILVPKGTFQMGSTLGHELTEEDELPQHNVTLNQPYWVSNTPITQMMFRAVVGKNPSHFKTSDHPVEMISWFDAIQFCNALSLREGLIPCYELKSDDPENVRWNRQSNGFRLLTESEWEYMAKADGNQAYAGSNTAQDIAWFIDNSKATTHSVKRLDPNLWGFYDVNGNVWEWCWDWFDLYNDSNLSDPIGPKEGRGRVFRGGSFTVPEKMLRVTQRGAERPHNRMNGLGLRVARNVSR